MLHIKQSGSSWPSGGYPFTDPKTGKVFDAMSADLRLQAKNVIAHRKANPRFYPPADLSQFSQDGVEREIVEQICRNRPSLCYDDMRPNEPLESVNVPRVAPASRKCFKCGGSLEPVYCKTCGGSKVKYYKCKECGTENPK